MASGAAFGGGGGAGLFEAVFGLTTVPVVENMTPSPLSFAEFWCPVTNGNDPIDEIQPCNLQPQTQPGRGIKTRHKRVVPYACAGRCENRELTDSETEREPQTQRDITPTHRET